MSDPRSASARAKESDEAGRLATLMIAAFVDTLGAFLVLALLPFYAEELGASALQVGALVAAFSVAQTISAPLWGHASDRFAAHMHTFSVVASRTDSLSESSRGSQRSRVHGSRTNKQFSTTGGAPGKVPVADEGVLNRFVR